MRHVWHINLQKMLLRHGTCADCLRAILLKPLVSNNSMGSIQKYFGLKSAYKNPHIFFVVSSSSLSRAQIFRSQISSANGTPNVHKTHNAVASRWTQPSHGVEWS